MKLNFEVNYGFVVIVIFGKDNGEFIEWNGYLKDIDECYNVFNYRKTPGEAVDKMIEFVNEHYSEYIDKSELEWERELYGCGPIDCREEF
ncbi:MAG: hypothetical protein WBF90_37655 [Rivularia sp. (in: cyanobacteria)]